ncbi:MAG: rRNA methyltransferase, partial [Anaerolineae bacterium]
MSTTTAFPLAFLARMAALLDEDFPSFLVSLGQPPLSALRVNTLKVSVPRFLELSPWELQTVPWCPEAFLLPRHSTASMYPLYDAGLYYLQEPSTTAVASLLAPRPGERVLDLCAAPGGKATHLAALMQGQGVLVA